MKKTKYSKEKRCSSNRISNLYGSGKPTSEIVAEYDFTRSALQEWIRRAHMNGSFVEEDNEKHFEQNLRLYSRSAVILSEKR